MRNIPHRLLRAGTAISVCLFRPAAFLYLCFCWLALLPSVSDGQTLSMTHPNDLLAMDPDTFTRWLHSARPIPVSAEEKRRVLASLPLDGEVIELKGVDLLKLAGLKRVLQAADRDTVYVVKVIDVPQAAIALHGRAVVLISETALGLLNTHEVQAVAAHEIAHEYVWDEYARAVLLANGNRVRELELMCDAIAIITLNRVGIDSSRLISGIEKIDRFNRDRLGTALNESNYPTVAERRAFARSVRTWQTRTAAVPRQPEVGDFHPAAPVSRDREWSNRHIEDPYTDWPNIHVGDPYTRDAATSAVRGASQWLARPKCQTLFLEFKDERQVPLTARLRELETDPEGYLRMVLFLDGEQSATCRRHGVVAFTARGSRVIYLCGRDFERAWHRDAREGQATIIHELLHSLGLGENPPSTRRITDRVRRLCWQ